MEELSKLIEEEIRRLKNSGKLMLTEGWADSPHYQEGWNNGQYALLIQFREMIEHFNQ